MNRDRIDGNLKQVHGKVKELWGRLVDDQSVVISGKREQLAGRTQEQYGVARDAAERQQRAWETRYQQFFEARPKL